MNNISGKSYWMSKDGDATKLYIKKNKIQTKSF